MKTCILLLSAPRSGSSCFAGCVNLCGVSLGKNIATVKDKYNEKGYFENNTLLTLHSRALRDHGISFFDYRTAPQIDSVGLRDSLTSAFNDQFNGDEVFAIKDPRILLMKPSYLGALKDYGANIKVLAMRRNRERSAASMAAGPWGVDYNGALGAHDKYTKLLDDFGVKPVLDVQMEDLITEPKATMQVVCAFTGVDYNPEVESFVEKRLVHQ